MLNTIPRSIRFISFIVALFSLFSEYYLEIWSAMFIFGLIFSFFWHEKTPSVILAALLFQWLSLNIGYIYILFTGVEHHELLRRPQYAIENINTAYWLSIIALFFFMLGLKISLKNYRFQNPGKKLIAQYDTFKIIILYCIFSIFSDLLFRTIRFAIPGLAEPVNMLSYFKWSLFFMMIYLSFVKNEYKKIVITIMIIEVLIGFSGIFSEFKDIFFMFPIVYLSFNKLHVKQILLLTILAVVIFNIGVIWTYVKVEQRIYLSGGERAQIVKVSKIDALKNLYKLTSQFSWQKYNTGLTAMIQRIYYTEYFSATIKNIPYRKPYFEGELWNDAIKHVLMPRILFPNKEVIDDSEQTTMLTGIQLAGRKQGTSISVGYVAESYADFGPYYMFFPIFVLGFIIGYIYKTLSSNAINPFWSMAIIFPMFFLVNISGMNAIKVTGRLLMFFLVFFIINKFVLHYIDKLIIKK